MYSNDISISYKKTSDRDKNFQMLLFSTKNTLICYSVSFNFVIVFKKVLYLKLYLNPKICKPEEFSQKHLATLMVLGSAES